MYYGILDWIEADIVFALLYLKPDSGPSEVGFGDMLVFSKIKILGDDGLFNKEEFLPEIVLEPPVLISTGDDIGLPDICNRRSILRMRGGMLL